MWMGAAISMMERSAPAAPVPSLVYGAAGTAAIVGGTALAGAIGSRLLARLPSPLGLLLESWLLKTTLSARSLIEAGLAVEAHLGDGELDSARDAVTALVSRETAELDGPLLTSAAIESLAENTSDSIVAPLLYYAIGGLPAALGYRAANTLDAMIGYRGQYEYLGKAAARLDDALNLLPSRLSSLVLLVAGAIGGGDVPTGLSVTLRDHNRTASPNAGWPMSTMAGLLGTRLEKPGHYQLGCDLPPPDLPAIDHAAQLVKIATGVIGVSLPVVAWLARRFAPRQSNGCSPGVTARPSLSEVG
jgi:adenosylcobinamide-phosphate synthase